MQGNLRMSFPGLKASGWLLGSHQRRRIAVGPGLDIADWLALVNAKGRESLWSTSLTREPASGDRGFGINTSSDSLLTRTNIIEAAKKNRIAYSLKLALKTQSLSPFLFATQLLLRHVQSSRASCCRWEAVAEEPSCHGVHDTESMRRQLQARSGPDQTLCRQGTRRSRTHRE